MELNFNDKNPTNSLISLSDFKAHYLKKWRPNVPPYTVAVLEYDNSMIERFVNEVLAKRAVDNKVPANDAAKSLELWLTGNYIRNLFKNDKYINIPTQEQIDYWLKFFKQDVKTLAEYGPNVISAGFNLLIFYYAHWVDKEKYEKIFNTDNFDDWHKNATSNVKVFSKDYTPFDIRDISDKAQTILKFRIDMT